MFVVFYSTNDVFRTEEIFLGKGISCQIVPTPVQDKAYCGVCIKTEEAFDQFLLNDMEYEILE